MTQTEINTVFIKLAKRAEKVENEVLVQSFVDVGPLLLVLDSNDNQILFGRRGTGKTHAFKYLKETRKNRDIVLYVDLRNIGSSGGIYSDTRLQVSERATRLLVDTLAELHNELLTVAVENRFGIDLSVLGDNLDAFGKAITQVKVIGETEVNSQRAQVESQDSNLQLGLELGLDAMKLSAGVARNSEHSISVQDQISQRGELQHRVHFGELRVILQSITETFTDRRLLILLDEWSAVPLDLQPYLADLLRRSLFPLPKVTVKIAAIEKRSQFRFFKDNGDYIGIELGCDSSADANLDDYMLFDNDEGRAIEFHKQLVFKHFVAVATGEGFQSIPDSPDDLIRLGFTQPEVFYEFVRSSEGIPRDAFSVLLYAAQENFRGLISMGDIRRASRTWFQRDKESAVAANASALKLLHWIIDEVIGKRSSRAFLLDSQYKGGLIDSLFDSRVIHLVKKNISTHNSPGQRYDVYKIDYGCYVDLLTTSRSPQGLLPLDNGEYTQVPVDDYRTIRRAILDLSKYEDNLTLQR